MALEIGLCYGESGMRDRVLANQYQEEAHVDGASPFNYLTPCVRAMYARSPQHQERLRQMRLAL